MSEERELGTEEKQFTMNILSGMDKTAAARTSGIVPPGTSTAVANRIADQALDDARIRAEIISAFEAVDLKPEDLAGAIKRNLTTKNYGLWQKDGTAVELGDDGMTQMTAAKLAAQIMGWTGTKPKPVDQNPPPVTPQIIFNVGDVRRSGPRTEETIIDGDRDYRVS